MPLAGNWQRISQALAAISKNVAGLNL